VLLDIIVQESKTPVHQIATNALLVITVLPMLMIKENVKLGPINQIEDKHPVSLVKQATIAMA